MSDCHSRLVKLSFEQVDSNALSINVTGGDGSSVTIGGAAALFLASRGWVDDSEGSCGCRTSCPSSVVVLSATLIAVVIEGVWEVWEVDGQCWVAVVGRSGPWAIGRPCRMAVVRQRRNRDGLATRPGQEWMRPCE